MNRRLAWTIGALLVWIAVPPLQAGSVPKKFTLGQYVPDTCWMLMHGVHNPERAYMERQWGRVWEAVKQSGIKGDIKKLIADLLPKQQRAEFEEQWAKAMDLGSRVSWG
ncbi:MAG: hypothetical protein ACYSVY_06690, partial [Planctomycetota bacterium]